MLVTHLALVSESDQITPSQLNRVAAALQKQAIRDFDPIWKIPASVDAFDKLDDVPVGYWPMIVRDDIQQAGAAGVHLDNNGQPFSLIEYSDSWSMTASHEMLEMLGDPGGNRLVAGQSPKPGQGVVEFLVEVADPSEAPENGYTINGMLMSDFFTPNFYDPVAAPGVRYSFTGKLDGPRKILPGGYISWHDPVSDHWWQQIWFDSDQPRFRDLGRLTARAGSLRSAIDSRTGTIARIAASGPRSDRFAAARTLTAAVKESTQSRANGWRSRVDELQAGPVVEGTWEEGDQDNG
ncbi:MULTISPECIES: hypothetical protein [unclassified Streptomyces]|uniref:hypothetical protein n=1 Tax=unclassified Streptomyces TaxID=2593676 RepID=UPI002E814323|nr:hypothetical protein [Streptomyces sp. NBC_00589]WTI41208.1 hypothetical protein OIC96_42510 [Streptomyces sp. NBC_00775]WUB25108.1 hypothetical protein OHA51_07215 [Streptomyces sp. NBC_00589]